MKECKKLRRIKESGIVAILRKIEEDKILDVVEAIYQGGIDCIEVTFNTDGADRMIKKIKNNFGEKLLVGAGTVINEKQTLTAIEAGAEFILSPSLHREVIEISKKHNVISIPGAYTPTEIAMAHQFGGDMIKVFPAAIVGTEYIKMIKGPLDNVDVMAVGGIDLANIRGFFRAGVTSVGIGGALTKKEYIDNQQYEKITEVAKGFIEEANKERMK